MRASPRLSRSVTRLHPSGPYSTQEVCVDAVPTRTQELRQGVRKAWRCRHGRADTDVQTRTRRQREARGTEGAVGATPYHPGGKGWQC